MTFFVKQKVTNYFLLSAFQAPRLNRKGWGIKCLIYAVEGTPGHGEQLKGKGPRARPLGAESCPRPLVLKAGVCAPGVQKSREKEHCSLTPGQDSSNERQSSRWTECALSDCFQPGKSLPLPAFSHVRNGFLEKAGGPFRRRVGWSNSAPLHS